MVDNKKYPDWLYQYRTFVGPTEKYDIVGALQFCLFIFLGLREEHTLLDIGCGSLRSGRLFITYLQQEKYFGIEPEQWLIEEGIKNEIGHDLIKLREPSFSNESNYDLGVFSSKFDYILAHSIFSHAPRKDISMCISNVREVMNPESIFVASYIEGETNYDGDKWVYPDGISYTYEFMKELVQEQGLSCISIDWPHPNLQKWLGIVMPGNESKIPDLNDMTAVSRLQSEIKFGNERITRLRNRISDLEKAEAELKNNTLVKIALRFNDIIQNLNFK